MPRNNTPMIIGAVIFGLLAIGLTMFLLLPKRPSGPTPPPGPVVLNTATQYVAKGEIPPRTSITADMLRPETVDKTRVPAAAITDSKQLDGAISGQPIHKGEVVTTDMVSKGVGRVTPVFFQVPQGTRAVAVFVDTTATAAGLVDVGDHVDVIANLKVAIKTTGSVTGTSVSARTIAQNLLVLAVDRSLNAPPPTPTPAPAAPGAPPPPPPPAAAPTPAPAKARVILAADNITAEHLVAANEAGSLHLTLRNPSEASNAPLPEVLEYPTRIVAAPPPGAGRATTTSTSTTSQTSRASRTIRPEPPISSPSMFPLPPAAPGVSVPAGPPTSEVTVIRGTEKTRVIVPADSAGH